MQNENSEITSTIGTSNGSTSSPSSAKISNTSGHDNSARGLKSNPYTSTPNPDPSSPHLYHSLSHSEDAGYTTSEIDDENETITITEPSGQVTSGNVATVSFPHNHFDDFTIEQIRSSGILVATENNVASGERITHLLHPEDYPPGSSNVDTSTSEQTETSPNAASLPRSQRTIRFRSRVRITSGVGKNHARHARRSSSDAGSGSDVLSRARLRALASLSADWGVSRTDSPHDSAVSVATSRSSSISSSISAPIRFREDESPSSGRPSKWGPLGQRVQLFVGQQRAAKQQRLQAGNGQMNGGKKRVVLLYDPASRSYVPSTQPIPPESPEPSSTSYSEESPLLNGYRRNYKSSRGRRFSNGSSNSSTREGYDSHDGRYDGDSDWGSDGYDYETRLNQEIEKVFGPWPGRLLNRHVGICLLLNLFVVN
ncbi:hypothetical protein K435DRAFT_865282 [Dendrothele bispora CBS 962.96]|uniref:Uncharacterized protein n=1 Tax=Dendrothele bispora (strain CBS 962.96) TaxID=1314807 RepID=A0A4S8LJS4_DENBC|nr:hypothetical protein K435DRAFT_865282 [Dendrothele bispora CBS 962.96]